MTQLITHACTTLMNVDSLTEQQCRAELKNLQSQSFDKDLQLLDLKQKVMHLDGLIVRICDHFIEENFSKLHAEVERLAKHLQEQRAESKVAAARKVRR